MKLLNLVVAQESIVGNHPSIASNVTTWGSIKT